MCCYVLERERIFNEWIANNNHWLLLSIYQCNTVKSSTFDYIVCGNIKGDTKKLDNHILIEINYMGVYIYLSITSQIQYKITITIPSPYFKYLINENMVEQLLKSISCIFWFSWQSFYQMSFNPWECWVLVFGLDEVFQSSC